MSILGLWSLVAGQGVGTRNGQRLQIRSNQLRRGGTGTGRGGGGGRKGSRRGRGVDIIMTSGMWHRATCTDTLLCRCR